MIDWATETTCVPIFRILIVCLPRLVLMAAPLAMVPLCYVLGDRLVSRLDRRDDR